MTLTFPDTALVALIELELGGVWEPMSAVSFVVDDYFTDYFTDEFLGRTGRDLRRLFDQAIQIDRGTSEQNTTAGPMGVSFVLDNLDGHLTPHKPESPYYPEIRRGLRCRVSLGGNLRFFGRVVEIAPEWPHGDEHNPGGLADAQVRFTARGSIHRLEQQKRPLKSAMRRAITAPPADGSTVVAYWAVEDQSGATQGASPLSTLPLVQRVQPMVVDDVSFGGDSSLVSSEPVATVGQGGAWYGIIPPTAPTAYSVNMVARVPDLPVAGSATPVLIVNSSGYWSSWTVLIDEDALTLVWASADGNTDYRQSTPDIDWGDWIRVGLRLEEIGGDVAFELSTTDLLGNGGGFVDVVAGSLGVLRQVSNVPTTNLSFGHVVVRRDVPEFGVSFPSGFAASGYVGEPAGERMVRLCADFGVPLNFFGDPSDTTPMGPQGAKAFYDLILECAEADGGLLVDLRASEGLQYRSRVSLYNLAVDFVLDARAGDIVGPFSPVESDKGFTNEVEVSRPGGSSYVASAWVEGEELYDTTRSMNVASDDLLPDAAGWLLHFGTWEGMDYGQVTIDLAVRPERIPDWVTLGVGNRIQVENLPSQHSTDVVDLMALGWAEPFSATSWKPVMNCAPFGPWIVGVLDDEVLGRLESDGTTIVGAIDLDDTSFTITTDGPRWIDSTGFPTEFPFDILVGGERMTVTAITGTGTTQTVTATRSVNGVVKAHPAGAAVTLAQPLVLAR